MDSGDEDLSNLLNNLQPNLLNEDYVFITLEDYSFDFFNLLHPIATFEEEEGLTLVITEESAKREKFEYNSMKCITLPSADGPIFLKANQKTGEIHARIENGLGEGILISCQNNDDSLATKTIGPFPLDFFD